MRSLILGGSGLIGTPIARALLARGHAVDVLTRGARALPAGARGLVADRGEEASLAAALAGRAYDTVVDLLAYDAGEIDRLFGVPGLRCGHYVMISTGQVYLVSAERRPPFREADADRPAMPEPAPGTRDHANWVYGMGKRRAEAAVRTSSEREGFRAHVLRLPVVQGAQDGSRRLWAYLQRLLDGGPLLLPEGGEHPVRFVWAEDVASAVVALAERASAPAFAYNVAMPDEPSLRELLECAAAQLGVPTHFVPCAWRDLAEAGLDGTASPYSGPWCSRPDPSLAARALGLECRPSAVWLPEVVRAHVAERDPQPHPGYARRADELALAARLGAR